MLASNPYIECTKCTKKLDVRFVSLVSVGSHDIPYVYACECLPRFSPDLIRTIFHQVAQEVWLYVFIIDTNITFVLQKT